MKKEKGFLGQGWAFPPDFSWQQKGIKMVAEDEDIKESLHILFSTRFGERIMQPQYGCDLQTMVFEQFDTSAVTFLKDTLETAIIYHEPRIKLLGIETANSLTENSTILFDIAYKIRTTNTRNNLVYPFNLSEATLKFYT